MLTITNGGQNGISWLWKEVKSGEITIFSNTATSGMRIFNSNNEEVYFLKLNYEKNRLFFSGDEIGNIWLVAVINDFSFFPSGIYRYELDVVSLIDDLRLLDTGDLEIINV